MDSLCACRFPRPGPLYWDWRCMKCDGEIRGWLTRWQLRRATRNPGTWGSFYD
jgi:hypothetical protein